MSWTTRIRPTVKTLALAMGVVALLGFGTADLHAANEGNEMTRADTGWTDREYADWDTDGELGISESEFDENFETDIYADWDLDASGTLDGEEWTEANWNAWDTNDDDWIDETEWNLGVDTYDYGDYDVDYGELADWDTDGDSRLGTTEFGDLINENAWNEWDADGDGVLGSDEAADTVWDLFDGNDDNLVDETEWNDYTSTWS